MSFLNLDDTNVFEIAQLLQFEVPVGTIDWLQQEQEQFILVPYQSKPTNRKIKISSIHDNKV